MTGCKVWLLNRTAVVVDAFHGSETCAEARRAGCGLEKGRTLVVVWKEPNQKVKENRQSLLVDIVLVYEFSIIIILLLYD